MFYMEACAHTGAVSVHGGIPECVHTIGEKIPAIYTTMRHAENRVVLFAFHVSGFLFEDFTVYAAGKICT